MSENVLITGGAGFIGSHLADALLDLGHTVTVLDILHPQIHGTDQRRPSYLNNKVELIKGDIRDAGIVQEALDKKTIVFHFTAYTGVGQSMYRIREYLDVNVQGTGVLLELLSQESLGVRKMILASSRAVYGEGAYECDTCGTITPHPRTSQQLIAGQWKPMCPICKQELRPLPTPESKVPDPKSVYAISKLNQEQIALLIGEAYGLNVVALRFFNVYGPRQSLRNPYTGVISTFISRLMSGNPPEVYEDGQESRDFVHVSDVVRACLLTMESQTVASQVMNIGSGKPSTLLKIAETVCRAFNGPSPIITGQFRVGDIRHCYADISRAKAILGFEPAIPIEVGIRDLVETLSDQQWEDLSAAASDELVKRGLAFSSSK